MGNQRYSQKKRTYQMCCDAVFKDPCAYEFVPDEFKTQAVRDYVNECVHYLFSYVPEKFITREMKQMFMEFDSEMSESEEENV